MDLYTKLSTISTGLNTFSCGNSAVKFENLFCENLPTVTGKKRIKRWENKKYVTGTVTKIYYKLENILKKYIVML